jgi:hypothetical protein
MSKDKSGILQAGCPILVPVFPVLFYRQ